MIRIEKHILKYNKDFDTLCFLSKNLYNYVTYLIRQKWIKEETYLSAYDVINNLTKENQKDYRALPAAVSQQIILKVFDNWKSFYKASKDYNKNPGKYKSRPRIPRYKDKKNGRFMLIFSNNAFKKDKGKIRFIKKILPEIRTNVKRIKQIHLVPNNGFFVINVIYNKEAEEHDLNMNRYCSIDLGINNLATLVTNCNKVPLLVNGRPLKSINQYYNKHKAKLQSYVGNNGKSRRLQKLDFNRTCKVNDYLHKASRLIINKRNYALHIDFTVLFD